MLDISKLDLPAVLYGEKAVVEPFAKKDFITAAVLKQVMPKIPADRVDAIAAAINKHAPAYQLNSPGVFHEFIATCAEESGQFTVLEENLNYSAERLRAVFPSRFPSMQVAMSYAHLPQKLANYIYANRMGNGGPSSGDGWKYRGGGPIQMTGHDMYDAYAKYKGITIDEAVAKVRVDMDIAVDSAMWVFVVNKGLLDEAQKDDFLTITKRINGGTTNMEQRKLYLVRAKQFIK